MDEPAVIAGHVLAFDAGGRLVPWTSWTDAIERELAFYRGCPEDHGYPRFASETFLDGNWAPHPDRTDTVPASQNGMGILSHLKCHEWRLRRGLRDTWCLSIGRALGDYLVQECATPAGGPYAGFTRSTGRRGGFPQRHDAGSQSDRPHEIEPDKGGIAGHALLRLFKACGEARHLEQALVNARSLAANQRQGDATHSPWPFRVDYRSGEARGPVSGNMTYILRLFDELIGDGYREFAGPRASLWLWIKRHQIPSAAADGALFAQFFEDHDTPTNRTAWAPLNLARYLLERRDELDPDWRTDARTLIDFVRRTFTHLECGVRVCHEQDEDHQPWGGINSTYGAVLALAAKAEGSPELADEARQALDFTLYSIDEQGRPRDLHLSGAPGGWQTDAHTDVLHNFMDAIAAFPEWA